MLREISLFSLINSVRVSPFWQVLCGISLTDGFDNLIFATFLKIDVRTQTILIYDHDTWIISRFFTCCWYVFLAFPSVIYLVLTFSICASFCYFTFGQDIWKGLWKVVGRLFPLDYIVTSWNIYLFQWEIKLQI